MKNSKLILILNTFTKAEFKEFEKFIDSPFFSTGRNLKPLYKALKKFYPAFNSNNFTRENLFSSMYPNKPFNDVLLRKHVSDMIGMAVGYIRQMALRKESFNSQITFLTELMARKIDSQFHYFSKKLSDQIKSMTQHYKYYYQHGEFESLLVAFYLERDHQEKITENVIRRSDFHIIQLLSDLSGDLNDILVNHHAFNSDLKDTVAFKTAEAIDFEKLITGIKNINPSLLKISEIHSLNILSIIHPMSEEYVLRLKKVIENNIDLLERNHKRSVLINLTGRLIEKYRMGKPEFLKLAFDVNKILLKENLLRPEEENDFPIIGYKSLINIAIRLEELEWTEKFINDYHKQLAPEYQTSMKHYGYAYLYFKKRQFSKALEECSKVKFENIIINYDIKILNLKIYYEMGSFETAISFIDAFKHFFTANKFISESYRDDFRFFVYFVNELIKTRTGNNRNDKDELIHELNKSKPFQHKDWIMAKAKELM